MPWIPDSLRLVPHEQPGLLTRRQLHDAGMSTHRIRWALGRQWRLVHGGVVATTTGRLHHRAHLAPRVRAR